MIDFLMVKEPYNMCSVEPLKMSLSMCEMSNMTKRKTQNNNVEFGVDIAEAININITMKRRPKKDTTGALASQRQSHGRKLIIMQ